MIWSADPRWRAAVVYARSMGAVPETLPASTTDWEPWHRAAVEGADWFVRREAARATTSPVQTSALKKGPQGAPKVADVAQGNDGGLWGL